MEFLTRFQSEFEKTFEKELYPEVGTRDTERFLMYLDPRCRSLCSTFKEGSLLSPPIRSTKKIIKAAVRREKDLMNNGALLGVITSLETLDSEVEVEVSDHDELAEEFKEAEEGESFNHLGVVDFTKKHLL